MQTVMHIVEMLPWFAWIIIVAIVFGTTCGTVCAILAHRERMAMIRMGMHPDLKRGKACCSHGVRHEKPYYEEQEV